MVKSKGTFLLQLPTRNSEEPKKTCYRVEHHDDGRRDLCPDRAPLPGLELLGLPPARLEGVENGVLIT